MLNQKWIELIESKREEIQEALKGAYKDSITDSNTGMREVVELHDDGDITRGYVSQNSFSSSSFNGTSIYIAKFNCYKLEVSTESEIEYITECFKENNIQLPEDFLELDIIEKYDFLHENNLELYEKAVKENFEAEVEYEVGEKDYSQIIDDIIEEIKREEQYQ
jgi:hypothetical protein